MSEFISCASLIAMLLTAASQPISESQPSVADALEARVIEQKSPSVAIKFPAETIQGMVNAFESNFTAEAARTGEVIRTNTSQLGEPDTYLTKSAKFFRFDVFVGPVVRLSVIVGSTRKSNMATVLCISPGKENARFFGTVCGAAAQKTFGNAFIQLREGD